MAVLLSLCCTTHRECRNEPRYVRRLVCAAQSLRTDNYGRADNTGFRWVPPAHKSVQVRRLFSRLFNALTARWSSSSTRTFAHLISRVVPHSAVHAAQIMSEPIARTGQMSFLLTFVPGSSRPPYLDPRASTLTGPSRAGAVMRVCRDSGLLPPRSHVDTTRLATSPWCEIDETSAVDCPHVQPSR